MPTQLTWQPKKQGTVTARPQAPSAVFSDDGKQLFAGSFAGTVRRWDLTDWLTARDNEEPAADSGKKKPQLPESAKLLTALEPTEFGEHGGWVEALATRGDRLVTADSWGRLCCWDIATPLPTLRWQQEAAHDGWIRAVQFIQTNRVATCGRDQTLRLWDLSDGKLLADWKHTHDLTALAGSDESGLFVGDARGGVVRWTVDEVTRAAAGDPLPKPSQAYDASLLYKYDRIQDVGGVKALAIDDATQQVAVAGAEPSRGATVQGTPVALFFDRNSGELKHSRKLGATKDCYVHALQRHPEGFWMAVTCGTPGTGQLLFFDPADESPMFTDSKTLNPHSLCFNPDTRLLCVTTTNRGSNGNGRRLNKDGEYEANSTPIELLTVLPVEEAG